MIRRSLLRPFFALAILALPVFSQAIGTINTVLATSVALDLPQGLSVDSAGNLYFGDHAAFVRKVDTSGNISTFAGNGSGIDLGENVPATSVGMTPTWTATDTAGNLYILDGGLSLVRKAIGVTRSSTGDFRAC